MALMRRVAYNVYWTYNIIIRRKIYYLVLLLSHRCVLHVQFSDIDVIIIFMIIPKVTESKYAAV